jgi:hypothetical protein
LCKKGQGVFLAVWFTLDFAGKSTEKREYLGNKSQAHGWRTHRKAPRLCTIKCPITLVVIPAGA